MCYHRWVSVITHKVRMTVRTAHQRARLEEALSVSCDLFNAALEERSSAWRKNGRSITKGDQQKSITALAGDPSLSDFPVNLLRWPLAKLDLAYQAFFQRVKAGQTPGHPRFKAKARWDTFGYTDRQCWKFVPRTDGKLGAKLNLSRIGTFRLSLHRPIEGEIRSLQIKREGRRWFALISVRIKDEVEHTNHGSAVGCDLGTTHLVTLSTGEHVPNPREGVRRSAKIAMAQRALARGLKGSKRRARVRDRYAALKRQERNARTTHLHQVSARLAREYETIVFEALKIPSMVRSASGSITEPGTNIAQKSGLNRSIHDAGWGRLMEFTSYKAARAGGKVMKVDPKHSSNECHRCGVITPTPIGTLFKCGCGNAINRDHNAALVILNRGVVTPVAATAKAA